MEKTYECRTCKKLCVDFHATYRNQCMQCQVLRMRNIYKREKLGVLRKRELEMEHRRLQKKIRKIDEYEMCDDDISQSEKSSDEDYVEETPVKMRVSSLTQTSGKRKDRKKNQSQFSERDNDSEQENSGAEELGFFLSRKEREELAKKKIKGESKKKKKKKQKVVEREQERE